MKFSPVCVRESLDWTWPILCSRCSCDPRLCVSPKGPDVLHYW